MEQEHKEMSVQQQAQGKKTVSWMPPSAMHREEEERQVVERETPSFTK